MPTAFLLRPLTATDSEACAAIHAEGFGSSAWPQRDIAAMLPLPGRKGWAAIADDALSGFILVQENDDEAEILTIATATKFLRQGIGQALLSHIAEISRKQKLRRVILEVAADNTPAIGLYEKLGFVCFNVRKSYYRRGAGAVDALMLELTL